MKILASESFHPETTYKSGEYFCKWRNFPRRKFSPTKSFSDEVFLDTAWKILLVCTLTSRNYSNSSFFQSYNAQKYTFYIYIPINFTFLCILYSFLETAEQITCDFDIQYRVEQHDFTEDVW